MKRILSVMLAVVMFSGILSAFSLPAAADNSNSKVRRVISVVYDDSGSMFKEKAARWANANYAMQSFCSMLNSEDELYITYMSDPNNAREIDLSNVESEIENIRYHDKAGNTPFKSVETAYNKLASLDGDFYDDDTTQYWLVIISDGTFNSDDGVTADNINSKLSTLVRTKKLANGTYPLVKFFGIGSDVAVPKDDDANGIDGISAATVGEIRGAMSDIATVTSGRAKAVKVGRGDSDKSIKVTSKYPVRSFVVFVQGSAAKLTETDVPHNVEMTNEAVGLSFKKVPQVLIDTYESSYNGMDKEYTDLEASSILIKSDEVIEKGTYTFSFDGAVDPNNVEVFLEPAVELVVTVECDGTKETFETPAEFKDYFEQAMRNTEYKISYKIREIGNDKKEYKLSDFNKATVDITVTEKDRDDNDKPVGTPKKNDGKSDLKFTLTDKKTEIKVTANIDGYTPVSFYAQFDPKEKVMIDASFGENCTGGFKRAEIAGNKNAQIFYTVTKDDKEVTDNSELKKFEPTFELSVKGAEGQTAYENGKIVYTLTSVPEPEEHKGIFFVEVKCKLNNGITTSKTFTIKIADYSGVKEDAKGSITKTEFFGNDVGVSFYFKKDNSKMTLTEIQDCTPGEIQDYFRFDPERTDLVMKVETTKDGTVTVTPVKNEEHPLTFWNWWINWAYYFGLDGNDVTVKMSHPLLDSEVATTINVVGEDFSYMLLNVYAPLIIEIIALTLLIIWIFLIVTKPRYNKGATLFVGEIRYNKSSGTHTVRNFSPVKLEKFNKVKRGNGRLKFKGKADVVSANGLKIRADRGGRIFCEMMFPWYKGKLEPSDSDFENLKTPADVAEYISKHKRLEINEFVTTEAIENDFDRGIAPANARMAKYTVVPDSGSVKVVDGKKVINSGKIFIYVNS